MAKRLANLQPRRKTVAVKRPNPNDTTFRNINALKRKVARLEARVDALERPADLMEPTPGTMPQVDEPLTVTPVPVPDSGETS